jgi:hypothetical protein
MAAVALSMLAAAHSSCVYDACIFSRPASLDGDDRSANSVCLDLLIAVNLLGYTSHSLPGAWAKFNDRPGATR